MKNTLVIDDLRLFCFDPDVFGDNDIRYSRTVDEGIDSLSCYEWDYVWLDHDLGPEDIIPVVEFMVENKDDLSIGQVFVHSSNVVGRKNVVRFLESYTDFDITEVNLHDPEVEKHIIVDHIDMEFDWTEFIDAPEH